MCQIKKQGDKHGDSYKVELKNQCVEKREQQYQSEWVSAVLGVQSTRKSTLLNTMFGLQFPVSNGRCTLGAFMALMKVRDNFQLELESMNMTMNLATLVVGLSDITIVNMAMGNTTEMKDIWQIVVHAFLRMKEIGRKPKRYFVHQNVSDVSAHENNRRDRVKLMKHLNEMTKIAANMEKKPIYSAFSDIMMYDPDKSYIPGLRNGVPPMASVNIVYSETIYELKAYLIELCDGNKDLEITVDNELKLKLFILGNAVGDFQQMHKEFVWKNDPLICLGKMKHKFYNSFQYLFLEKDENWKRAKYFCALWLKTSCNSESKKYSTRGYFQFTVKKTLLETNIFSDYLEYISDYETFVKKWIDNCVLEKWEFHHLRSIILSNITKKVKGFLNEPKTLPFEKVSDFLAHLKEGLRNDLVLSDDMDVFCLKDDERIKKNFFENLEKSLDDTEAEIISEMKAVDKETIISNVVVKPADELFKRVFANGKPVGLVELTIKVTYIHRPTGLERFISFLTQNRCHDICTTNTSVNKSFKAEEFHEQFAEEYQPKPAEYPEEWNTITKAQAERSLHTAFGMKSNT
ncbi:hypothetical protein XELAEV_18047930mg [Xenopus laevis]|uniref:VLIG-type G domain-containing protein n=1 Tax=Xenopus laevis TaxID=8355 RepID=A0A974BW31_XENLA|nr:hypothetical protein XELAEV_18047930mg [Xenopus laevis]